MSRDKSRQLLLLLSTVGSANDNSDGVVCHTYLISCCNGGQGPHRGDWSFPDGTVLPFAGDSVPIGLGRGPQRVVIRRTTATGPTGIYRCAVTWTRDSITVTEGNETVLNNAMTAQYTHTLNVTTGGEYTCTVSNNKPSSDSASITLTGIQCL